MGKHLMQQKEEKTEKIENIETKMTDLVCAPKSTQPQIRFDSHHSDPHSQKLAACTNLGDQTLAH